MASEYKQKLVVNTASTERFRFLIYKCPAISFMPDYSADNPYRAEQDTLRQIAIATRSVTLPGLSNPEARRDTMAGQATDFAYELSFNNLTLDFKVDDNYYLYNLFLIWMLMKKFPEALGGLIDHTIYREAVFTNAVLISLDNHMQKAAEWTFEDLHPVALSDITFDYGNTAEIYATVQFAYTYYKPTDTYEVEAV